MEKLREMKKPKYTNQQLRAILTKLPRLGWINVLRNFVGGRPRDPRYH